MYQIYDIPKEIDIGKQGESGILTLEFDISAWLVEWPGAIITATYFNPVLPGLPPLPTSQAYLDGDIFKIKVLRNMTVYPGKAEITIRLAVGDDIEKHSKTFRVVVERSHSLTSGTMPDIFADWVSDATAKLAEVDHFVDDTQAATAAANAATGLANAAAVRAENGEDEREDAEGLRVIAEQGRHDAYELAEAARDGLYDAAETARDGLYDAAEAARDGLYDAAEAARDGLYDAAEADRDGLFEAAETTRNAQTGDAVDRANTIAETLEVIAPKWSAVDISASGLAAGAAPTASVTQDVGGTHLTVGIPKGDKGDTGNVMYATFDIDFDTGELVMTIPDGYTGPTFSINDETGELEVSI